MAVEIPKRPLGELVENCDSVRVPVREADRHPGPYPYYGASGIVDYVDKYLFDGEYLLVAEDGENLRTLNTPAVFLARGKFWVNNHAHVVKANRYADTRYLLYALTATHLGGFLTGSTMPKLTQGNLSRILVPVPRIAEQRAIASTLGTLDDKIELNRRMNETLEAMAHALFKSWFVDFDPVHAKAEGRDTGLPPDVAALFPDSFEDSELGQIPKGWQIRSLDQVARFLNGLAMQKYPPVGDKSLPVIKIAQLRSGCLDGADSASADLAPEYIVADGDILFSWSGTLQCVVWAGGRGALNQHLFKVVPTGHPRWLTYYAIRAHLGEFQQIAAGKATTMGHIQRHHLSEARVAIPKAVTLTEVDRVVTPLFESNWKRDVESRSLSTLRDMLLPKLLSGELRADDVGDVTAASG